MDETPIEISAICPMCYPDIDSDTYTVSWCWAHAPDLAGIDDAIAKKLENPWLTGSSEAGGLSNQAVCEQIHQHRDA